MRPDPLPTRVQWRCDCGVWMDEEVAVHYARGDDMQWIEGLGYVTTKDVWVAHRRPKNAAWRECR